MAAPLDRGTQLHTVRSAVPSHVSSGAACRQRAAPGHPPSSSSSRSHVPGTVMCGGRLGSEAGVRCTVVAVATPSGPTACATGGGGSRGGSRGEAALDPGSSLAQRQGADAKPAGSCQLAEGDLPSQQRHSPRRRSCAPGPALCAPRRPASASGRWDGCRGRPPLGRCLLVSSSSAEEGQLRSVVKLARLVVGHHATTADA